MTESVSEQQKETRMVKMRLEHIVLGVLIEHPRTGYDMKRFMDTHGRFIRANTQMSQVYRALGELADRGWATFDTEERPGAQNAKIYRATSEGETVFLDWLTSPYTPGSGFPDSEFGGRLHFAGFYTRQQLVELLDAEISGRQRQVARYRTRDRTRDVLTAVPFDSEVDALVSARVHTLGATAMDQHIADMIQLRDDIVELWAREGGGGDLAAIRSMV
jgi:DNA-binding PadR family transcriptional regulator